MTTLSRRVGLFAALTLALAITSIPLSGRTASALAAPPNGGSGTAGAIAADVSAPAASPPQVHASASGLTTAQAPYQVTSGKPLPVEVRTTPRALVTLTVTFADGSTIVKTHRANGVGVARFALPITYQPQSSAEAATVAVTAVLPRTGLNDTVQPFNVTVLPHVVLSGRIRAPSSAVLGRYLTITVVSAPPNVAVRLTLTYPDGQPERRAGYTDPTTAAWSARLRVSAVHGAGDLQVSATLSYGGVQRALAPVTVHLRAAP